MSLTISEEEDENERLAAVFRALAEPVRLRILERLAHDDPPGKTGVCELADSLGLPQPNVSHHLGILKGTGLVRCIKDSCKCYYIVNAAALEAAIAALRRRATPALPGKES